MNLLIGTSLDVELFRGSDLSYSHTLCVVFGFFGVSPSPIFSPCWHGALMAPPMLECQQVISTRWLIILLYV